MSLFNDTISAFWTVLEADETWAALMTTKANKIKLTNAELLHKLTLEPSNCPLFGIAPEPEGSQWPPARRRRGPGLAKVFAVGVEGAVAGQPRAPILAMAEAFFDAIEADMQLATGSVLAALDVDEVDYQGLSFLAQPNQNDVIESWSFRVTAIVRYRES